MENKLCRICGNTGQNFINIFKTEGLKNKIETCLPILVSPHCLLPDTLCLECLKTLEHFYIFLKNCLQNIIVLESQLDIQESCLKTKRKKDQSFSVNIPLSNASKCTQTEDYLNILLGKNEDFKDCHRDFPLTHDFLNRNKTYEPTNILVDYEVLSDTNSDDTETDSLNTGHVILGEKSKTIGYFNNVLDGILCRGLYKDWSDGGLITEIAERKNLKKRSSENIEISSSKICRIDSGNKRKCNRPKKVEKNYVLCKDIDKTEDIIVEIKKEINTEDINGQVEENVDTSNENCGVQHPQRKGLQETCLLCNIHVESITDHFVNVHAKEISQQNTEIINGVSKETFTEKKKKNLPSLLKISDLRKSECTDDGPPSDHLSQNQPEENLKIACPHCPSSFAFKAELFIHLQLKHSEITTYLCGICLKKLNSLTNLKCHVENCVKSTPVLTRYYCEVCYFGENNYRSLETHVLVHGFLLENCKKEVKNFDPEEYIRKNPYFEAAKLSPVKNFTCLECNKSEFDTFVKFSEHRRNVHSIYHCDLCNKFYGRNSHLWKHVHRLHKGHPSVTCQMCFKTSASKYHLAQHFLKIHQVKTTIKKEESSSEDTASVSQKFCRDDVKPVFKKQDSTTTDQEYQNSSDDEDSSNQLSQSENDNSSDVKIAPKEIDPSHNLYTNILTNYTPPKNEGDFKCPKCSKGFHKRMLLRKHKKNCRPKLQKDLLTRCKSCARIFKDRQSLAKHLVNYHSDYVCEICSEKVPSKCEIVTHIRFQHPSSHLVCSVCENILRCKKDLLEHLAEHENSYVCQFCGDTLSSKVKLKMHILSLHRKILSLSCGICLKLFENQHVLRNHVTLIHKEQLDPMTSCPVCGKNYGSKWKTFDHVNKSHGKIFKACKICLEIYETEAQLESHVKMAHLAQQIQLSGVVKPNPAAMLSRPSKNGRANLNSSSGHNGFESNSDDSTEDTENNTQSSESEDEENSRTEQQEHQKPGLDKHLMAFSSQENKITLLEKRLIGKTVTQNIRSNEKTIDAFYGVSNNEQFPLSKIKKEEDNCTSDIKKNENHLIHHSKRTVYVNSNDPSFCEICHKTWPAKKHLWQHYIRCHKRVAATVCGICLKTNQNYESLQTHLRENHPTLLHGQGFGSNFICRICGRYHNASSKLSLHMVIHENFDWKLLDRFPPILRHQMAVKSCLNQNEQKRNENGSVVNGNGIKYEPLMEKKEEVYQDDDEMYDDMIEQVEESSSSCETQNVNKQRESSSDAENKTNALTFSNLLQTLKNHNQFEILNQYRKNHMTNVAKVVESSSKVCLSNNASKSNVSAEKNRSISDHEYAATTNLKNSSKIFNFPKIPEHSYLSDVSSSMSDCERDKDQNALKSGEKYGRDCGDNIQSSDLENESQESEDGQGDVDGNVEKQDDGNSRSLLRPKLEELDSAVKSISDPCTEPLFMMNYNDFPEPIPSSNCLNDSEIENAVGSIL